VEKARQKGKEKRKKKKHEAFREASADLPWNE